MNYLEGLNEEQEAAVLYQGGPLLILAGAGSGKTRVITTRIVHQIESDIASPYEILAMTFTNKAAREMKSRIEQYFGGDRLDLSITTFHSFCARFLRREMAYLDRETNFAIFDSQDQMGVIKRLLKEKGIVEKREPPNRLRTIFSNTKNSGDVTAEPGNEFHASLYRAYNDNLKRQNALDFDDLIMLTCHILTEFEDCRNRYQNRFRHMLVDEFQDTNKAQFKLIQLLTVADGDLCVVGDEDQSIYGWRGADINNILDFRHSYSGVKTFKLERNYRSTQPILDFANAVIAKNLNRHEKKLWTEVKEGESVQILPAQNERDEASLIGNVISRQLTPPQYRECAILFRANYLSRSFEDAFRRLGIPYQLVGGLKFYDRKEIKDLLAYARAVVNPRDWTSCCRALGVPSRSIGARSLELLTPYFKTEGQSLLALKKALADKALRPKQLNAIKTFVPLLEKFSEKATSERPSVWLQGLIDALDYRAYLEREDEGSAEFRVQNIDELMSAMSELEQQGVETMAHFMDYTALVSDQDELDDDCDKISLMTVHAAKGLEFDHVFVVGLEEGVFPNQRAMEDSPNALEEERRLFYVAATRAKRRLVLSHAQYRQTFGTRARTFPSRFVREAKRQAIAPGPSTDSPKKSRIGDLGLQLSLIEQQLASKDVSVEFRPALKQPRYRPGDSVEHATFGAGRIVGFLGRGTGTKVSIHFAGKGTKLFYLDRVPLKKIE